MLYIFHVDIGFTITVDINITTKTVSELKEEIEREFNIPPSQQVLLMSGGESLESSSTVGSYSAGTTDTNPIFLFNKASIESQVPPAAIVNYVVDDCLDNKFRESLSLPVALQTLFMRSELATHCCVLSRDQVRACERLVHDQHLQQQGWAAVLANLEDITNTFRSRLDVFQQHYTVYLSERQQHIELLKNFNLDLQTLEKIPILPALQIYAASFLSPSEQQQLKVQETTALSTIQEVPGNEALSLLKWIAAKDNQNTLEQVMDQCSRTLEQFDDRILDVLKNEAYTAIEAASKEEYKEIKGLSERLYQLEKLVQAARKCVNEQHELAQGFQQNVSRVTNLKDDSVLPDLCTSHKNQLTVMHNNYKSLCDYRRRCTKAKEELSVSIHRHLKWIVQIENKMMELDGKLVIYHESLRRLRRQIEILRQIHLAPQMYMSAIAEVVRRRTFSEAFLVWASNLACQILNIHTEELQRRRDFQSKFEGHFLASLFPGLEDTPPPFATEAPAEFDVALPKLTIKDVERMKQQLPDLASSISMPDLNSITQFFFSKSFSGSISSDANKDKEIDSIPVDALPKQQEGVRPPLLSDRGDFESETDTEEFEKIGQATMDSKQTSYDSTKQQSQHQARQKQLEENLSCSREEVERLRAIIRNLRSIASESFMALRRDMESLKQNALLEKNSAVNLADQVNLTLKLHGLALREREQELTVDHELELSDLKKIVKDREDQIESIKNSLLEKETQASEQERLLVTMRQNLETEQQEVKKLQAIYGQIEERLEESRIEKQTAVESNEAKLLEINALKSSLEKCQERIKKLEEELVDSANAHQKSLKEESDRLQLEYKTELETIRSRFKLMAASTMERSPSDSSLEKIERADVIELVNHETILEQTKKDLEIEKEEAVRKTIEDLRIANEIIKKNEQELEAFKLEKIALLDECQRYKSTVDRLKETESLIQELKMENMKLESENHNNIQLRDSLLNDIKVERDELKRQLNDERMKMSQENIEISDMQKSVDDKNVIKVSESKKVKLEADGDLTSSRILGYSTDGSSSSNITKKLKEFHKLSSEEADITGSTTDIAKDMNASVSVMSDVSSPVRVDAATSTELGSQEASSSKHSRREKLSKSTTSIVQKGKASLVSCNRGDTVIVLWDQAYRNYIILQDSSTLYFLNSDCVADLDLKLNKDGLPNKLHVFAEVVEKEYCSARKPENRYRVPKGTKFYRVRVKPLERSIATNSQSQ